MVSRMRGSAGRRPRQESLRGLMERLELEALLLRRSTNFACYTGGMLYHQRGLTGHASREMIATPRVDQEIQVGQAFAWNPSITGTTTEEMFVLTGPGPEVITRLSGGGG